MSAYRKILVAVDGSPASDRGFKEALRIASREKAALDILHVVNENMPYPPLAGAPPLDVVPMLVESGRRVLATARAKANKQGVAAQTILLESLERDVARRIVEQARKRRADLVVLGTHGRRGLRRLVLGSDAERVVRTSPVPVLLVRAPA